MKVKISIGEVNIRWQYSSVNTDIQQHNKIKNVTQDVTLCEIRKGKDTIASSEVRRYVKDEYSKPEARKMAFSRAIKSFSYDDRKAMWEEFLNTIK